MTDMLIRPSTTFDFPPPVKPVGTLLDVALLHEGVSWLEPQGLVESYNCLTLDAVADWPCPPEYLGAPTITQTDTATSGGTVPAATYRLRITLVNDRGETTPGAAVTQTTTGAASTVTIHWAALPAGVTVRVYASDGPPGSERLIASGRSGTSYTMTDPPATNGAQPPAANTALNYAEKSFVSPAWQDGIRFGVYGGITCKGPGFDMASAETKAKAAFLALESVGVERALMTTRFVDGATWDPAPDLTPAGGAVSPAVGLAILEGDAACNYAGPPIIHVPREIASLLSGAQGSVVREGDSLITKLGSKVAAGGGYGCPNKGPAGTAPAAGEKWMYASGSVAVARGEVFSTAQLDRATNVAYILVERAYVAAVDCYTAAVRVKVA